jgi:glycosyltransferase involved in cell wall biosynthesis
VTYRQSVFKRKIESILIYPIILLGKLFHQSFPIDTNFDLIMFCPSADIGGANKVNADICKCFPGKKILIVFSKKPKDNGFLFLFEKLNVTILDLHKKVDIKYLHFINIFYRGVLATWINKMPNATVFGGESIYFYKVLPYIHKNKKRVELTHVNKWLDYTQAFIPAIDTRIFSTENLLQDAAKIYRENNLPSQLSQRLKHIDNSIPIPENIYKTAGTLQVVFIGRGSPQKRVPLVAKIAQKLHEQKSDVHVSFAGDVSAVLNINDYPFCTFYGNVAGEEIKNIYEQSDVLLLTSAFEGLPIAVMEMMAYGKVVVSTAVNAIPDYIVEGKTGFLLPTTTDENIIEEALRIINNLSVNKHLLDEIGAKSRAFALSHFSEEIFCREYRMILFE